MSEQSTHHSITILRRWMPFLIWGREVNRQSLLADLLAGLSGAIVVLPQGVAYAMIAGLPPEFGLYTAIIVPIITGLFGSSRHMVSGPAAAISIVVLSVVSSIVPQGTDAYIPAVLTLTLLAGLFQFGFGLARMGTLVNFISHTVVIGFTAGAAMLIASSQFKQMLGLSVPAGMPFYADWSYMLTHLPFFNGYSLTIALTTIFSTLLIKKLSRKIPAMLFGMMMGSLVCWLLQGESHAVPMVGALSGQLPAFIFPDLSATTLSAIIPGALAIAILGLVEAVAIARAIAIQSGQRIDGNQEFIGQGLANVVGSFFSCFMSSGSFTRSGVNYDAGAKTPLAVMFAALMLVLVLLFAPQITAFLPLPAMAGAIMLIAWNLINIPHIRAILRSSKQETTILLVTFISTLIVALEFSIYLGVLLSLIFYLKRTSTPRIMEVAPKSIDAGTDLRSVQRFQLPECPQHKIIRIDGSVFFGAVDHIQKNMIRFSEQNQGQNHIIINCTGINFIDYAGAEMLIKEARNLQRKGFTLSFCALKNTVKDELEDLRLLEHLGEENFYATIDDALNNLVPRLNPDICQQCSQKVFKQCP
ncbi:SulP family inorganic anion transporter [Amphritea sp. 1_MG-2023]|uniref:SulP family inorganic anion transporter n=1 Tax=Amphritea sp. 1_MG-2023 TaxID=3062670 RepID=UPI0026E14CBF|nr:SulP family inorganic anion transporter [Amphritea sp. 1_MG-2023]MDO6563767.1 SulP family inorganic anion transporter [Amphritea sp. 1_MG-2023]